MRFKLLAILLLVSACSTPAPKIENINVCPSCPIAGPRVADDLEKVCKEGGCTNIIEWLQRFEKTCDILKLREKETLEQMKEENIKE